MVYWGCTVVFVDSEWMKESRIIFFIADVICVGYIIIKTAKIVRWFWSLTSKVFLIADWDVFWDKLTLIIKRMNRETSPEIQSSNNRMVASSLDFWKSMSLWIPIEAICSNWKSGERGVTHRTAQKRQESGIHLVRSSNSHSHYTIVVLLDVDEPVDSAVPAMEIFAAVHCSQIRNTLKNTDLLFTRGLEGSAFGGLIIGDFSRNACNCGSWSGMPGSKFVTRIWSSWSIQ